MTEPPGSSPRPHPDTSVRVAWADDAAAIAAVQVRGWQDAYADVIPVAALETLPVEIFEARWRESIVRPGEARQRVLVALERATVRGFAATMPATDPDLDPATDGDVTEFAVDPGHRNQGHGSRLLHAVADTLRSDSFSRAVIWVMATDDPLRAFLTEQGWASDGAHRELDLHGDGRVLVKAVRLHTDLTD